MDFGGLSDPLSVPTVLPAPLFFPKQTLSGKMQPFRRMKDLV